MWPPVNLPPPLEQPVPQAKKSVSDLADDELAGKRVLVRCDLNVPLSGGNSTVHTHPCVYITM
jgi:hypothetical protein